MVSENVSKPYSLGASLSNVSLSLGANLANVQCCSPLCSITLGRLVVGADSLRCLDTSAGALRLGGILADVGHVAGAFLSGKYRSFSLFLKWWVRSVA